MDDETLLAWQAANRRLDQVVQLAAQRNLRFEKRIQELENRIALGLQNARSQTLDMQDSKKRLEEAEKALDLSFDTWIPLIRQNIGTSEKHIGELEEVLPQKLQSIEGIHELYKSGRRRAQILETELSWLTMSWFEQVRRTALLQESPRSKRWQRNVRILTYLFILIGSTYTSMNMGDYTISQISRWWPGDTSNSTEPTQH
ncbi:hypothetical protein SISSUDRAFT_808072 [Sistotremastrum suecicum HHB10207 ss-3]|uniref:Uncharacterized protein n=1 Tax=Sistotremastrum suecicum HHB10207 ss-3 TaxID=1314776 RepID=A0A166CXF2_9AGAM|nr:hypothetical protein SISSUDRAFT_808072 [Sistotremastrum suecicum HHB10207 ss-3]